MANELKHKTTTLSGGDQLPRVDWEGIDTHEADGQTLGDVLYYSGTYWIRKPLAEVPLTGNWDIGPYQIRALQFYADAATGTAPFIVASTTLVSNLNADQVDSQHRVLNINADHTHQSTGAEGGKLDHGAALDGLVDDDHTQYHNDARADAWLATKEADYAPSAMVVNTGTLDAGTYADLAALGGTDVAISEGGAADPLRVTFTFSSVTLVPNNLLFFGYYSATLSVHYFEVEIYNVDTTNWDSLGTFDNNTQKRWYNFPIYNGSTYVNGSNEVQLRLRHVQSGNVNHDLFLDFLVLQKTFGAGGGLGTVVDSPVDGADSIAISANWAYDHEAAFNDHSARHENGGADEISVAGLSGVLADLQDPNLTQGTFAARPAAGVAGKVYWTTDGQKLYRDNGVSWDLITNYWFSGTGFSFITTDTFPDQLLLDANFTDLNDVPAAYTGAAGKVVAVNGTEDGLEFITAPSGGGVSTGATFPGAPDTGELFLHVVTGRKILYEYDGSNWVPLYSLGAITLYVDNTDGTDDLEAHGIAADADAFATVQFAIDCIPSVYTGNIIININAETYAEDVIIRGKNRSGNYTITLQGTLTAAHGPTAQTASVQGATTTMGSISDTTNDPFTGHANDLLYSSNNAEYRLIKSVTSEVATIVGYWSAAPSGNYTVYTWATNIRSITVDNGANKIICNDILFSYTGGTTVSSHTGSVCEFYRCSIYNTTVGYTSLIQGMYVKFDTCLFNSTGTTALLVLGNVLNASIIGCKFITTSVSAAMVYTVASILSFSTQPCYLDGTTGGASKANVGLQISGKSLCYPGNLYHTISNFEFYGIWANEGSLIKYVANNQYTGNGTNESAEAASYSVIIST